VATLVAAVALLGVVEHTDEDAAPLTVALSVVALVKVSVPAEELLLLLAEAPRILKPV
jgi:hypothetical protein